MKKYTYLSLGILITIIIYSVVVFAYPLLWGFKLSPTESLNTDKRETIKSNLVFGNLEVVIIGDSTAAGQGTQLPSQSFAYQYLSRYVSSKYSTIGYTNLARGGSKVQDVLDAQVSQIPMLKTDLVIVSIGANDVTALIDDELYRSQIQELADKLKLLGAQVIWLSIPDFITSPILLPPLNYFLSSEAKTLNSLSKPIIESAGFEYIDVYNEARDEFAVNKGRSFSRDGYHPSEYGYSVWADIIQDDVKE